MFKLVGVMEDNDLYAIQDTDDEVIDVLPKGKVCKCLSLGFSIGGITQVSDDEFEYTSEYFFNNSSNENEEDYEEDDYADYDDSEDYDEEEYEDSEDEEEYDYGDDYGDEEDTDEEDTEEEDDEEDAFDDGLSDEDYGEEEQEVSTVNKLYSHLNEEQIKLLKRYYLWFSQRIFDEGRQQKRTLQVTSNPRKLQKQKELNAMRNQGGMWAYAGFIDMGYRGADYCTMGHPLRYVHLAWDISVSDIETSFFGEEYNTDIESVINSSNCIKFGIDCISDFFEIDKEYTDRLKRAQREAIKDMDFMCQYYEDGIEDEVISSFTVMDEIINHTIKIDAKGIMLKGNDYKCLVPKGLSSFYKQFRQLNMVVPKSLVQEIRDNLIGWTEHKFIGWRYPKWGTIHNVLENVLGKTAKQFMVDSECKYSSKYYLLVKDYLLEFFQLKSCGYYEYNADNFKEEGGASKPVKSQLYAIHNNIKKNFWENTEYTFDFIKKLVEVDRLLKGISELDSILGTPSLAISMDTNRYYLDTSVEDISFRLMREYSEITGIDLYTYYDDLSGFKRFSAHICKVDYNTRRNIDDFITSMNIKYGSILAEADKYQEFALKKIQQEIDDGNVELDRKAKEREKEKEEKRLAEEKRKEEEQKCKEEEQKKKDDLSKLSDEEVRQYCFDNADKVKGDSKLKFALTVLNTVKKTGKCSDKQMYYVNQVYEKLTGVQKNQSDKVSLDDRKDIEDAIDIVLADPDLLENEDDKEKVYAIITSIKRYRSISVRQMKYAEIALKVVKEN